MSSATIKKVMDKHNPIEVWGDGEEVRDIIYIEDFVDGLVTVMEECKEKYEVVNIGSNKSFNINTILTTCMAIADYNAPIEYISGKPSMIPIRKISSDKMKTKYQWEAKHTLIQGLRKTMEWYEQEFRDDK